MIKDILRLGIILFVISAIATGILAWVNSVTLPKIVQLKVEDAIKTRQELMPTAKTFDEKKAVADSQFIYYLAKDENGNVLGYSFIAAKWGYSSVVKTMVALNDSFEILNLKVIEQNETPGLGTHCLDRNFPDRFIGKKPDDLKVDKDGGEIKSITGATITSRAITNSLKESILKIKSDVANQSKDGVQ